MVFQQSWHLPATSWIFPPWLLNNDVSFTNASYVHFTLVPSKWIAATIKVNWLRSLWSTIRQVSFLFEEQGKLYMLMDDDDVDSTILIVSTIGYYWISYGLNLPRRTMEQSPKQPWLLQQKQASYYNKKYVSWYILFIYGITHLCHRRVMVAIVICYVIDNTI